MKSVKKRYVKAIHIYACTGTNTHANTKTHAPKHTHTHMLKTRIIQAINSVLSAEESYISTISDKQAIFA